MTVMLRFIISFLLLLAMLPVPAWAATVTQMNMTLTEDVTQVTLEFDIAGDDPQGDIKVYRLSEDDPRIIVDFKSARIRFEGDTAAAGQKVIQGTGAIKRARFADRGESGSRLVLDTHEGADLIRHDVIGTALIIQVRGQAGLPGGSAANTEVNTQTPLDTDRTIGMIVRENATIDGIPVPRPKPRAVRRALRKPIVVIDPGHGGYDPGALGSAGTKEKDLTFKAAEELKNQLLATGRYQVLLTRSKDVYVNHDERLRIARSGGADLFISIHADSVGRSAIRGASVYTLADRALGRSKRIVENQNWIMDVDLTEQTQDVGDILVDLAQRSTLTNSSVFADILLPEIRKVSPMVNNSHREAGYFVLLAPDVPAVLLEMGFLSNVDDEANLIQAAHRKKLMTAVTNGINTYFTPERILSLQ